MADQTKLRVTREQVEDARSKLAGAGFPISGDSGTVEKDGYRIGGFLVGGEPILDVLAKPRFIPVIAVKARIRSMLAKESIAGIPSSGAQYVWLMITVISVLRAELE